jgi:hypothetical protein
MELGNGFSCAVAQGCPAQNLTTNVISGASQLCSGSRILGWSGYACKLTMWEATTVSF